MILATNKKAYFDYEIIDEITFGVKLFGHEVKSSKQKNISMKGSYVKIIGGELILIGVKISLYKNSSQIKDYKTDRDRVLLVKKSEIEKLESKIKEKGLTIVPLEIFLKSNLIKVKIGLSKGRKNFDKKNLLKERDIERDMKKEVKKYLVS